MIKQIFTPVLLAAGALLAVGFALPTDKPLLTSVQQPVDGAFVQSILEKETNDGYVLHFESNGASGTVHYTVHSDGSYDYVIYDEHGMIHHEIW